MSYTNGLDKPSDYFNTNLWTGTGSTQSITGVNFQPDWLWVKTRSTAANHRSQNSVIGAGYGMNPNQTVAEGFLSDCVTSFDSDGFTLGADSQGYVNTSSRTYVGWSWLASNTTASNTDGSITSTVSANTTSGFSIVSYTGNGTAGATIGHSLGSTPSMIITKQRNSAGNWFVYHKSLPVTEYLILNSNVASQTDNEIIYNDTTPSSTTFTVGNYSQINGSSNTFISYCFAEKKGFSKFGSYIGNGSSDGSFIYTGFKPAFVILKNTTNYDWHMFDNTRNAYNITNSSLKPNTSGAEYTNNDVSVDLLSNGFKFRGTDIAINQSGTNHIYMAFAENPFVSSTGIPTTAR